MGNKFITVGLNGREMFLKSKVDGASVRITIGPGLRRTLVRQEIQQLVTFPRKWVLQNHQYISGRSR
jgi:hypothetical protein